LVDVHARLFAEDVAEIQRRASEAGDRAWQPLLRKLIHNALRERRVIQ